MPSIIEELPKKAAKSVIKSFNFAKRKWDAYRIKRLEEEKKRRWDIFLNQTRNGLVQLVKKQIEYDQFDYTLQPILEEQEVIQNDGTRSVQMVHVADDIVPLCKVDFTGGDFQVDCIVFSFDVFGELDPETMLKMKEKWVHYLQKNGQYALHGIADVDMKNGLRYLVFVIYDKSLERNIKRKLFQLKNGQ